MLEKLVIGIGYFVNFLMSEASNLWQFFILHGKIIEQQLYEVAVENNFFVNLGVFGS